MRMHRLMGSMRIRAPGEIVVGKRGDRQKDRVEGDGDGHKAITGGHDVRPS
jgi:hypothetical protein